MTTGDSPFRVVYSEIVRASLRALSEKAKAAGLGPELLRAINTIDDQLHDPLNFGEPVFSLKKSKAHVRKAAVFPLAVCFAIYEEEQLVVVSWFRPLADLLA